MKMFLIARNAFFFISLKIIIWNLPWELISLLDLELELLHVVGDFSRFFILLGEKV